jgi:DNA-binding transcriptional ArsR family regulator
MADAITTAREAIEGRIQEIENEAARLRNALSALVGGDTARGKGQGTSASRRSPRRRRRKVAPAGRRREQLLSHLKKSPGAKPSEIAKAIGTTPANVQNVLRKARQDKVVRRNRDGGYAVSTPAKSRSSKSKPKEKS